MGAVLPPVDPLAGVGSRCPLPQRLLWTAPARPLVTLGTLEKGAVLPPVDPLADVGSRCPHPSRLLWTAMARPLVTLADSSPAQAGPYLTLSGFWLS